MIMGERVGCCKCHVRKKEKSQEDSASIYQALHLGLRLA
jgi:hypothetical protein